MKKITLLLVFICIFQFTAISQSCLPEGIIFTSQAQIDSFQTNYPGCTEIEGDVTIGNFWVNSDDIKNLNGLYVVTSIGGNLNIILNDELPSLTGLYNLFTIDGDLTIHGNPILSSLTGLEGLTSIGGNLEITYNEKLMDLSGLDNLVSLGGNLFIGDYVRYLEYWACSGNSSLNNISSLSKLTSITGDLCVICNTSLTDLYGLHNITSVGGDLIISSNDSLVNLLSLSHLDTIYGNLEIGVTGEGFVLWEYGNPSITDLSGLDNLDYVGGNLNILGNNSLNSLTGLDNLNAASFLNLSIIHNANLSVCETQSICDYLSDPGGTVEIHHNATGCSSENQVMVLCGNSGCLAEGILFTSQAQIDSFQINYPDCRIIMGDVKIQGDDIENLNGLNSLTSCWEDLVIQNNASLKSLSGLNNVTSIEGDLKIQNNASLTSLSGLDSLTFIGGLAFHDNASLTSLSGLNNVTSIEGDLKIQNNTSLTSLSGLDSLTFIGGLALHNNDFLTNLAGLDNLISIDGNLAIGYNDVLTSLSGIENINAASIVKLWIINNESLSTCHVQSICDRLAATNGYIEIRGNAPGCNSPEEVLDSCDFSSVTDHGVMVSISIHPNPFTTSTTIEYELTKPSSVHLAIYDYLGKQIEVIEKKQAQGKQQLIWYAEGLPAGVYFCVIKTNQGTQTTKLIKL